MTKRQGDFRLLFSNAASSIADILGFTGPDADEVLAELVRQRMLSLYEDGTYASWAKLGKALGVKRGTAHSIVYGYCHAPIDRRFLDRLETAEFRRLLPKAVETLRTLRIEAKEHYRRGELRRLRREER